MFIAVEGVDGVGKSTLLQWMGRYMLDNRIPVVRTREPGGTPTAERIRGLILEVTQYDPINPWGEACLFNAARSIHLHNLVLPEVALGSVVMSDRYCLSTYAYQGGGRGLDLGKLEQMHEIACNGVYPDITFILDADPKELLARQIARGEAPDRMELEGLEFQYKCRDIFLYFAQMYPDRHVIIDASGDIDSVKAQILPHLEAIKHKFHPQ